RAVSEEPSPPQGDGVATAPEFSGGGAIGGLIVPGQAEDDAGAEGESLWGRGWPGEGLELVTGFSGQAHGRGVWGGDGGRPCRAGAIGDQTSFPAVVRDSRRTAQGLQKRTSRANRPLA